MPNTVPIHIVPKNAATNDNMTTTQAPETLSVLGAAGAAERLPCMHLKNSFLNVATCRVSFERRMSVELAPGTASLVASDGSDFLA